jgi:hypothetical protein
MNLKAEGFLESLADSVGILDILLTADDGVFAVKGDPLAFDEEIHDIDHV